MAPGAGGLPALLAIAQQQQRRGMLHLVSSGCDVAAVALGRAGAAAGAALICRLAPASGGGSRACCTAARAERGPPALAATGRCFSSSAARAEQRLVAAYLQDTLSSLSIPHGELHQLADSGLSDAALTAWALAKTASHPAASEAAAAGGQLRQLLAKLDSASAWRRVAAASPLGQLLWRVAVEAAVQRLQAMAPDEAHAALEHQVLASLRHSASGDGAELASCAEQMSDALPAAALGRPDFWALALQAAEGTPALEQDLQLLGYQLAAGAEQAAGQLARLEGLLGVRAADLQQQLLRHPGVRAELLAAPGEAAALARAVGGDGKARQRLAELQAVQVLASALGLSAVQLLGPASACELARRLTGLGGPPEREVSEGLTQLLRAAAPKLLRHVAELPASALEQPSLAGLMQLMQQAPELKELAAALASWRAEAAAAGYLPVLTTLTQPEVAALSGPEAEALGRAVMRLEARGRLLLRTAAARKLRLDELGGVDADALAWKLHSGGAGAVERLVELMLGQAAETFAERKGDVEAAELALSNMAAGFGLEEATSRRSSAAAPSPLVMAGVPQHHVSELSRSLASLGTPGGSGSRGSARGSSTAAADGTAEALVRDLAVLLAPSAAGSRGPVASGELLGVQQAAALQRLQLAAHDLPQALSGPLADLLNAHSGVADPGAARQYQQRLGALVAALELELPRLAAAADGSGGGAASTTASGAGGSWAEAGGSGAAGAAEGVLELLGEQDTAELLAHAATGPRGRQGEDEGLYAMLADIHADGEVQRYLQMEFDPALELDLDHAPRGWRDPELLAEPSEFLGGMRPLLDAHLVAHGHEPLQELEWQVYRDAALAEHEQLELDAAAAARAAGRSPFGNSRADEAFLWQRLEAAVPPGSVLAGASRKYLQAALANRSWTFAQRARLVDRLGEIAAHLAAHPPRSHRGSPFSALFQPDGPPIVPRLSRRQRADGTGGDGVEPTALPAGFGGGGGGAALP